MKQKNYENMLVDRNLEIFELEQKVKELTKYKALYYIKIKEVNRMKRLLEENIELLPDQVKFNFKNTLEELSGIKYN